MIQHSRPTDSADFRLHCCNGISFPWALELCWVKWNKSVEICLERCPECEQHPLLGDRPLWGAPSLPEDIHGGAASQAEHENSSIWKKHLGRSGGSPHHLPTPASFSQLILGLIPHPNTCQQPLVWVLSPKNPCPQPLFWILSPKNP